MHQESKIRWSGFLLGNTRRYQCIQMQAIFLLEEQTSTQSNGWSAIWISKGGKEFLIKLIALALPTYDMSSFLLLLDICEKQLVPLNTSSGARTRKKNRLFQAKWERLFLSRDEVASVFVCKILLVQLPFATKFTENRLYLWTGFSAAKPLLVMGVRKKIHSSYEVKAWEDPWILTTPVRPRVPIIHPRMTVSDFIKDGSND